MESVCDGEREHRVNQSYQFHGSLLLLLFRGCDGVGQHFYTRQSNPIETMVFDEVVTNPVYSSSPPILGGSTHHPAFPYSGLGGS